MKITFAGHALIPSKDKTKELVKEILRNHILHTTTVTCYLGGRGDFDEICARACKELKHE